MDMQAPNLSFCIVKLGARYTGCSMFSAIVMMLQRLSLLNENSAERRKLQELERLEANEDDSTWYEQCSKKFVDIFVVALKNEPNEIVTVDQAWEFLNTPHDSKPDCLQLFSDATQVQHQTPYCFQALYHLLQFTKVTVYYYVTCGNNCLINSPGIDVNKPNILKRDFDFVLEWNPTDTSYNIAAISNK